ncbi:hypothetical protein JRQ81_009176 [Phrynocephalus forsythii]|uniref:Ig-like domain-containing protein n=1 Tax=Phrynocephalus forsythii TaxID=171643 RepID=A0A9Q1ASB7_9SAUR|nr:hypothetical protein JRQ81_009176 [Phrynocephalus forsythii]
MHTHLVGMILFSLHAVKPLESSEASQGMSRIVASLGENVTINCTIPAYLGEEIFFYKEKQDQSLLKIDFSSKYSKLEAKDQQVLTIHNVQRNDSGVYYCAAYLNQTFTVTNGTMLIVSGASNLRLAILVPSYQEETQVNYDIPLLCLFFDANPSRGIVSWNIRGETSQEQKDFEVINEEGAFTLWSLKLIAPKTWSQGISFTCSDPTNRTITAQIPKEAEVPKTGICWSVLHFGLPCIVIILLSLSLSLLFRKHLPGGNAKKLGNQIPMRQIPQTEYAELKCHK